MGCQGDPGMASTRVGQSPKRVQTIPIYYHVLNRAPTPFTMVLSPFAFGLERFPDRLPRQDVVEFGFEVTGGVERLVGRL